MSDGSKDLRERVTDIAGIAGRAGDRAAGIRDEVRAKGEQAMATSAKGARGVVGEARRNKVTVAVTSVAAAVIAAVLAGRRIIARRRAS
jgi:hypothetical protein